MIGLLGGARLLTSLGEAARVSETQARVADNPTGKVRLIRPPNSLYRLARIAATICLGFHHGYHICQF